LRKPHEKSVIAREFVYRCSDIPADKAQACSYMLHATAQINRNFPGEIRKTRARLSRKKFIAPAYLAPSFGFCGPPFNPNLSLFSSKGLLDGASILNSKGSSKMENKLE
jgi:hypothetical protein